MQSVTSTHRALLQQRPPASAGRTVTSPSVVPAAREQYRKLATALHHAQADSGMKTLVISSAAPGEGKTLTTTNLALTLSQSFRRRVLIVDADCRQPSLHEIFQVPLSPGLSEAITLGDKPYPNPIEVTATLSLLPAGRTSDSIETLSSDGLGRVLSRAREPFDWVLVDTPPVGLLSDAKLVAKHVDGVILVVRAGVTPLVAIQRAVEAFGRERIMGVVLNRGDVHAGMGGYYYGYGEYYGSQSKK